MASDYWLGIDLGGTKILTGLFDSQFKIVARNKQPTGYEVGAAGIFQRVVQAVDAVIREAKIDPLEIRGMGFAIPGQIVPGQPIVRFAPNLDWRNLNVQEQLPAEWTWPVVIENDCRLATFGEFAYGVAKGAKHVFGIFAGTGVGGGLILDGKLFNGFNGHAGEIGHIILHWRRGQSLESIAGRRFMMKRAKEIIDDSPKRVRKEWKGVDIDRVKSSQLAEFYAKDDPIAIAIVDDAARAIGAAIGSVINLLSPEVIVLGGGVAGALGETFSERIWDFAQKYALPGAANNVKFLPASLGDDSGIVGAAAFAKSQLEKVG